MASGSKFLSADGIVGPSGKPVRIWNATFLSGGTAGILVLRDGAVDTAQVLVQQGGTISQTATVNFQDGLVFPNGCFFDKDTNVTSVVVSYEALQS